MENQWIHSTVAVLLAVAGLATIAVLVSNQAQTGSVLGAGGSSIGNMIACAVSPITGGGCGGDRTQVTSTITFGGVGFNPRCGNGFTDFRCV